MSPRKEFSRCHRETAAGMLHQVTGDVFIETIGIDCLEYCTAFEVELLFQTYAPTGQCRARLLTIIGRFPGDY